MKKIKLEKLRGNLIIILLLVSFSLFSIASAQGCNPSISLISQDPTYATPGSYVDLVFQVSGVSNSECRGMVFELIESYPFSFDDQSTRVLEGSVWTAGFSNVWNIPYRVRVDSNAISGESEIEVRYSVNPTNREFFVSKNFPVFIQDLRTSFDAVIQDVSGSDVVIAIANTGKYSANSVVVRVPRQDNFRTLTTDGQMVGNLDSGDYTILSFSISPTSQRNQTGEGPSNIILDVHYTDELGERRIEEMELPLRLASEDSSTSVSQTSRNSSPKKDPFWKNKYLWALVILALASLVYRYHKKGNLVFFRSKKILKKRKESFLEVPDWIKNSKLKEGKK